MKGFFGSIKTLQAIDISNLLSKSLFSPLKPFSKVQLSVVHIFPPCKSNL